MSGRAYRLRGWPVLLAYLLLAACGADQPDPSQPARLSAGGRLSGDTAGYAKVTAPRPFDFPADHAAHPRYKHEWWYVTGQARSADGRRFGYQFTVFREAIAPQPAERDSAWATSQLYLAHAALTDVAGGNYLSDERFARGALGLAGARAAPLRVWLEDWQMRGTASGTELDVRLRAGNDRFGFDLRLRNRRPPVTHGDRGMSVKGGRGNASYYYSYTHLDTAGTLRVDDRSFEVSGSSWLDHEWSSSALSAEQTGWDWFSLRLSGGRALMVFRLRHTDDRARDFYSGTWISADGATRTLDDRDIRLEALDHWTSERSGVRYPLRWRLAVPSLDLALTIRPLLADQEFAHSFRYWEGAVTARGTLEGTTTSGEGYMELTGYAAGAAR